MARLFFFLIISLGVSVGASLAARADSADRVAIAFANWAYDVGAEEAVLTLWHKGEMRRNIVIGEGAADRPVELASLSKAITAVCVAEMLNEKIWRSTTTSFSVLGYGLRGITVGQLLTHSSGLGPDETQVLMPLWLGEIGDRSEIAAKRALNRPDQTGLAGLYTYNNENYAILGEMITQETGQPYERYCRDRVLARSGVQNAAPSEQSGSYLPFGGWQMSVQEYAAFMWHGFRPGGVVGHELSRWPQNTVEGPTRYGMGMFQRIVGTTPNFWHFGALCMPGRLNIGSYGVIWQGEWMIVAAYEVCPTWPQMADLDRMLGQAVFGQ